LDRSVYAHKNGNLWIVEGGLDSGDAWIFLSDHRPMWAEVAIPGVLFGFGPLPILYKTAPLRRSHAQNKIMLVNYKAKVERRVLKLPPAFDPADKLSAIVDNSICSWPKTKSHFSFYNSTR